MNISEINIIETYFKLYLNLFLFEIAVIKLLESLI